MRFRLTEQEAQWANKLWVAYGCIVGVHFLAQLFSYWFLPYDAHPIEFYIHTLAIPTLQMAAVIFVAQAINQADSRYAFFTLFLAGTFVAVTLIRLNTDIRIISAVFLLPILASALFFRIWLTWFSAALQLLAFVGLYYGSASYRSMLTPFDIIAILCFIVFCAFLMTILMMRGRELYEQLRETLAVKEQLLAQNAAIHQRSKIDALTGLYNQATFHEYFEVAMEYGADPRGATAFHLAIVDIDDFKSINDTYGHRVGDLVLQRIANVVREQLPTRDIAARYGGEEFALLLFEPSFEEALSHLERVRRLVSEMQHSELGGRIITVSIGSATYERGMMKDELFEKADARLYVAKRTGKNRTVGAYRESFMP